MEEPLFKAILKTICYADIFDYPLKKEEIWRWLITKRRPKTAEFKKAVQKVLSLGLVGNHQGYFFLKGREAIVKIRQKRKQMSQEKLEKARKIAQNLRFIPTVKMVAVTGNLAVENCGEDDDIDFLVVTAHGTLWLTRFLVTLFLESLRQRRRPAQKDVRDKICLNMFVDENYLETTLKEQNLYIAHEISQLKPLWSKGNTYQKFIAQNLWVENFLPNAVCGEGQPLKVRMRKTTTPLKLLEAFFRWFQLRYMRKRRTIEVTTKEVIRFHPQDAHQWIFEEYEQRLLGLPLDK